MKRKGLPSSFKGFHKIGGVLKFGIFEEADGELPTVLDAISKVIPGIDTDMLASLGCWNITDEAFFGDWYSADAGSLVKIGHHTTDDGQELADPMFKDLGNVRITGGAASIPMPGTGGNFAYAFSQPPYGLAAKPTVVNGMFGKICAFILPPHLDHVICDWSNPRLQEASPFFAAGMEWWGVYLFTIHVPLIERLTVIAGSSTD